MYHVGSVRKRKNCHERIENGEFQQVLVHGKC